MISPARTLLLSLTLLSALAAEDAKSVPTK